MAPVATDHSYQLSAIRYPLLWGVIAVAIFFATNPRMWADPFGRLAQSVLYHGSYAESAHVKEANFPFWQPLVWLLGPVPWHPGVFVVMVDTFITLLAGLGLSRLWREYRVFALWLAIGLGFLLIWPTKWPQYILTITAPLSLAAALGLRGAIWEPLLRLLNRRTAHEKAPGVSASGAAESRRVAHAGRIGFLIGYSEFALGWLFVDKAQNVTLAMAISGMIQSSYLDSWANLAALALMMSLPVVVIFLVLQKYLVSRLLVGSVGD